MSIKNKKIIIKSGRYSRRLLAFLLILFVAVFFVNAEGNNEYITYSDLSNAINSEDNQSENIEDYNIAGYFEFEQTGNASWYGKKFHNRKTASGELYNMHKLTAAHKKLPMGSIVRVTNQLTNESVLLRINDRGPFVKSRIIDLSYQSAQFISGETNPRVSVETLLAQDNADILPAGVDYFFGYSYDLPLVCIPMSVIRFLSITDDFGKAIEFYTRTIEENSGQLVYLFTKAGTIDYSYNNLNQKYFIGMFEPRTKKPDTDLVDNYIKLLIKKSS